MKMSVGTDRIRPRDLLELFSSQVEGHKRPRSIVSWRVSNPVNYQHSKDEPLIQSKMLRSDDVAKLNPCQYRNQIPNISYGEQAAFLSALATQCSPFKRIIDTDQAKAWVGLLLAMSLKCLLTSTWSRVMIRQARHTHRDCTKLGIGSFDSMSRTSSRGRRSIELFVFFHISFPSWRDLIEDTAVLFEMAWLLNRN
ncbi:hypothetical protein F3Y22_tig00110724pilonHSYRG00016 [Hibiscus syriacus]|uniref:Uncharacterized protein n=1 Tax=Hibiscus syriacus TaxID=106335 RepID=A0A6A2ZV23_HIBSY|nr:hypothetical protein F3Y22_tig00110724pilonHSYRG00016 [Hibiscus syriacus]